MSKKHKKSEQKTLQKKAQKKLRAQRKETEELTSKLDAAKAKQANINQELLACLLANRAVDEELFAKVEKGQAKIAKKEHKLAKKRAKLAALEPDFAPEIENIAAEEAFARAAAKAQAKAELSAFAYAPTRNRELPNPSNPFSDVDYAFMSGLLQQRLKPGRYTHSLGVAETAQKMAQVYGEHPAQARIAGLLHDWDKALLPEQLAARVADYNLPFDEQVIRTSPSILHGPTAAAVLRDQFPLFRSAVFQAIDRHTCAAPDMQPLDMIVYCADKLEPGRDVPSYRALYDQIGQVPLEDLFFQVLREGLVHLVDIGRPVGLDTIRVWNWYIDHLCIGEEAEA